MQNISEVLATYARAIHTVTLRSKLPVVYHPIPFYGYKLSSFAAYIAKCFISCAASHFARTLPNPGHVPKMSFLITLAYEHSSRPCAQLTLQYIALPRNGLQGLLLQLRFPPLFAILCLWMYSSIIVCTIVRDSLRAIRSSFALGTESAGRERLDSKLSCELYLRRSRVPMEVERGVMWGMLLRQN